MILWRFFSTQNWCMKHFKSFFFQQLLCNYYFTIKILFVLLWSNNLILKSFWWNKKLVRELGKIAQRLKAIKPDNLLQSPELTNKTRRSGVHLYSKHSYTGMGGGDRRTRQVPDRSCEYIVQQQTQRSSLNKVEGRNQPLKGLATCTHACAYPLKKKAAEHNGACL